jgi:hypothetical protein
MESKRAIISDCSCDWVVWPSSGVLKVQNLMPKGPEAEKVLKIVPDDASEWILPDQSGDNDSHKRSLEDFQAMHSPHPCGLSWEGE